MPVLQKFREYHYNATVKVSDNTRTLALSAIAIVWLFKNQTDGAYEVPNELLLPLTSVMVALALDFAQHVYVSISWHIRFRLDEKRLSRGEIDEKTELYAPDWINDVGYIFFYGKIGFLIFAYYQLLTYFNAIVKWV